MTTPESTATDAHRGAPRHDQGCLAASIREAMCCCSRSSWLREMKPRWQARAEAFRQISRWAAEKTVLAEGHIHDSIGGLPVFEAEAHKATARMAAAMYIEFGHMARAQAEECDRIGEHPRPTVVDVELPLFAEHSTGLEGTEVP